MAKAFMNQPPEPKPEPHLVTLHLTKSEALAVRAICAVMGVTVARGLLGCGGYPKGLQAIEMPFAGGVDAAGTVYTALDTLFGKNER